jgi:hypothetical protein
MNRGAIAQTPEGTAIAIPGGWREIERREDGVSAQRNGLRAIVSVAVERDDAPWIHLSFSRPTYLPTWADMREGKRAWLGDREAYIVFPSSERYVNLNPYVLHLWSRLDMPEGVLPNFDGVIDGVRTI